MLYDYYGFPPESYELSYPAPGPPQPLVQVRPSTSSATRLPAGPPQPLVQVSGPQQVNGPS